MNRQEKAEALMTVVRAYLARGANLQYDQRSMDRVIQLTPRRMRQLPPEAATEQFTLFLDCSSYMNSLIRETFGYILPSELTWNMVELVQNRIFFREFAMDEPIQNVKTALAEMKELMEVGDIITFIRKVGNGRNGHTVMYIGDNKYTHLTTRGRPNSYDYENKKSREYETGVHVDDLTELLEDKMLNVGGGIIRVALERPLDIVGEPTKNTVARCTTARGLVIEVLNSHGYGKLADMGDTLEYRVSVRSTEKDTDAEIHFSAPEGTTLIGSGNARLFIKKNEVGEAVFKVILDSAYGYHVDGPKVNVNGLDVFTHKIPIGKMLTEEEAATVNSEVERLTSEGTDAFTAAATAYSKIGIMLEGTEADRIRSLFAFHDATCCDLLSRNYQQPKTDMALFSYFGGSAVTTPEMVSRYYIRTNKPRRSELAAGDIILVSCNATATESYCCYYTGDKLIGKFDINDTQQVLIGAEVDEFVDSLLGRFCFVVLRPSLGKSEQFELVFKRQIL